MEFNSKHAKLFFLCACGSVLISVYWVICNSTLNIAGIKQYSSNKVDFCFDEIIEMLKDLKMDETNSDANSEAVDILISSIETWMEKHKHVTNKLFDLKLRKLDTMQEDIHQKNLKAKMESKFGAANFSSTRKPNKKDDDDDDDQLTEEEILNIHQRITILFNFNSYRFKDLRNIDWLLKNVTRLFPGVRTIVKFPEHMYLDTTDVSVTLLPMDKQTEPADSWNNLVEKVKTRYVLVMKDVIALESDFDLTNLLKKLLMLNAEVVGGARKQIHNGHWDVGCYQMDHKNYVLAYKSGYRHSKHSCVYCHHISGPFLTTVSSLRTFPFVEGLSEELMFNDFFLKLFKEKSTTIAVCPENMFVIRKTPLPPNRIQWLPFGIKNEAHKIITPDGKTFEYSCEELGVQSSSSDEGKLVPRCCMKALMDHIKFIMKLCRDHFIVCELSWGTELEAVKFNGIPPWEPDGDISFFTPQTSELWDLRPIFEENGYTLYFHEYTHEWDSPWFRSESKFWRVDLFNRSEIDSVYDILRGRKPTKVLFDGEWVETSSNVGSVIQTYGSEIYQHKSYGISYSDPDNDRHYEKCSVEGDHDCADLLATDGNIDFGEAIP